MSTHRWIKVRLVAVGLPRGPQAKMQPPRLNGPPAFTVKTLVNTRCSARCSGA